MGNTFRRIAMVGLGATAVFLASACGDTAAMFPIPDEITLPVDETKMVAVLDNDYSSGTLQLVGVEPADTSAVSTSISGNQVQLTLHRATITSVRYVVEGSSGTKSSHILVMPAAATTEPITPPATPPPTATPLPPTAIPLPPSPTPQAPEPSPTATPVAPPATATPTPALATPTPAVIAPTATPTPVPSVIEFEVHGTTTGQVTVGFLQAANRGNTTIDPIGWSLDRDDIWLMVGQDECANPVDPGSTCTAYVEYLVPSTYTDHEQVYNFEGSSSGETRAGAIRLFYPVPQPGDFEVSEADSGTGATITNLGFYDAEVHFEPTAYYVSSSCHLAVGESCRLDWAYDACGEIWIEVAGYGETLTKGLHGYCAP